MQASDMTDEQKAATSGLDLCLAPMQGITDCAFRETFCRHFGGLSRAVSPFLATVKGTRVKPALLRDVLPARNTALPLVPQVLGKDPADLAIMLVALRDLGYRRADLNSGCPWPMVARKGRGAGLLSDADVLRKMLAAGCTAMPGGFSIKVRLGLATPDLLAERMEILNEFPLFEVAIHPRTARQMYDGCVNLAAFSDCLKRCRHPVVYNGDIRTPADGAVLRAQFPSVRSWMLGRGVVADPWLAERLRGDTQPRDLKRLRNFLDDMLAISCAEMHGEKQVLGRFKEWWGYLAPRLSRDDVWLRRIRFCQRVDEYRRVLDELFRRETQWIEAQDGLVSQDKVKDPGQASWPGAPITN